VIFYILRDLIYCNHKFCHLNNNLNLGEAAISVVAIWGNELEGLVVELREVRRSVCHDS
jgi:hypothetical protein